MNTPNPPAAPPRTVAVVVSYNRRDLLVRTLRGIASGTSRPEAVVVVDNASADGSADVVRSLELGLEVDLVELGRNVGGAGGFTVGIEKAVLDHRAELVWIMDDDTEPHPDTLAEALRAWGAYAPAPEQRPAVLASRVLWTDGREHPMNTMREWRGASSEQKSRARAAGATPIRSASFVSVLFSAQAVREQGLPVADYFLWNDDFEYTTRLARSRGAIQVPSSVVTHHTVKFGATDADPGPRFYHEVRNKVWTFTRSHSLTPSEKVLYVAATLRRWARTFLRSSDRRSLLDGLRRGVRDGLRAPRSNEEVLAGTYRLRPVRGQ